MRRRYSGHLLVCLCDPVVNFLDVRIVKPITLCLAPRLVHFARPWTEAFKPVLTDSSLAAKRRVEALHVVFFFIRAHHHDDPLTLLLLLLLLLLWCTVAPRRVHFPRPWTEALKPALTDSSLAAKTRAEEALHVELFFIRAHRHDDLLVLLLLLLLLWCTLVYIIYVATKNASRTRCSSWCLGPSPRSTTASYIVWLRSNASTAFAHRGCSRNPMHRDRYSHICVNLVLLLYQALLSYIFT